MNILLQFTKNNTKISTVERTSFGEDAVKSYSLQEYAGWYGIAFVGEDDLSNVAVTGVSGCFFAAGGVYTSSKPIIESCDLDEVLKTISGHYLIIQQKKGCAVSIVTDPLLSIPMYIYKDNDSICMSTRLDWLLMQSKRDWNVSWEQIFSFVLNSSYAGRRIFVDDIYLADYGSIYSFSDTGELVSNQYWKPSFSNKSYSDKTDYKTSAAIIEDVVRAIMDKHNKVVILV